MTNVLLYYRRNNNDHYCHYHNIIMDGDRVIIGIYV